jgi:hypothetical protein
MKAVLVLAALFTTSATISLASQQSFPAFNALAATSDTPAVHDGAIGWTLPPLNTELDLDVSPDGTADLAVNGSRQDTGADLGLPGPHAAASPPRTGFSLFGIRVERE